MLQEYVREVVGRGGAPTTTTATAATTTTTATATATTTTTTGNKNDKYDGDDMRRRNYISNNSGQHLILKMMVV